LRGAAIAAFLALAGCSQMRPGEYALPIDQAYAKLAASNLPDIQRVARCGVPMSINTEAEPRKSVTWYVLSDDVEMVRIIAYLTPLPENRTKVSLAIWNQEHGDKAYDGTQFYRRPAVRQPLRPLLDEQISSILEARPYSTDVQPLMADGGGDSVCNVQGAGRDRYKFSVNDDLDGEDSSRSSQGRSERRPPGMPDPSAGRPTVHVRPGGR
jgi:hypothetical protein